MRFLGGHEVNLDPMGYIMEEHLWFEKMGQKKKKKKEPGRWSKKLTKLIRTNTRLKSTFFFSYLNLSSDCIICKQIASS